MYEHLEHGGILNIDSLDEAKRVVAYCKKNVGKQYTCGIRINMDLGQTLSAVLVWLMEALSCWRLSR